jgi:hypothetical protein
MKKYAFYSLLALISVLLLQCASPRPQIEAYRDAERESLEIQDSVEAGLQFIVADARGIKESVAGRVFIHSPGQKYRLQLKGPLGMSVASMLWQEEKWLLVLYPNELYHYGQGEVIQMPGLQLPMLPLAQILAPLRGELLPAGWQNAERIMQDSLVSLEWFSATTQSSVRAHIGAKTGLVQDVVWMGYRIDYSDYERQGNFSYPQKIRWSFKGKFLLEIRLKDYNSIPQWQEKLWNLSVPEGFRQF